jgi:hypothetical protein
MRIVFSEAVFRKRENMHPTLACMLTKSAKTESGGAKRASTGRLPKKNLLARQE